LICTCATNADGIFLCNRCCEALEKVLSEMDSVVGDLVRAVPRASLTASYGERVSATGSQFAPLPVNEGALDAHIALDRYLMVTALELAKVTRAQLVGRDTSSLSSYILTHIGTLRTQTWAGDVEPSLRGLVRECEKATRTATQAEFAGTCPEDGTELFTHAGGATATCRTCSVVYEDIQGWRTTAKAYARATDDDIVGYPKALSERLAKVHGETITPQHIRLLASKGVLERINPERGEDGKVLRPVYRLGDVKGLIKKSSEEAA
jgi:hypothetical protein